MSAIWTFSSQVLDHTSTLSRRSLENKNKSQVSLVTCSITVGLTTLITMLCARSLFHVTDLAIKLKVLSKVRIHGQLELSRPFPNKTSSVIKLSRMKQNVRQRVSFDLPIEVQKACWGNGSLFKKTLLIVCNTACLVPVCLGDAGAKNLEPGGLRASRSLLVSLEDWC